MNSKTTVERAFELARSGKCRSVQQIRDQLSKERYPFVREHLDGVAIRKQLTDVLKAAKS